MNTDRLVDTDAEVIQTSQLGVEKLRRNTCRYYFGAPGIRDSVPEEEPLHGEIRLHAACLCREVVGIVLMGSMTLV